MADTIARVVCLLLQVYRSLGESWSRTSLNETETNSGLLAADGSMEATPERKNCT